MNNLLAPLRMTQAEAAKFVAKNVCAFCFNTLYQKPITHNVIEIECLNCGPILSHNYTSKHIKEQIEQNNMAARIELSLEDKPVRSEAEILKELGF